MDKFESQFADLDVQTSYMEDTMQSTTAGELNECVQGRSELIVFSVSTPQDQIDNLMSQMADEANIELEQTMEPNLSGKVSDLSVKEGKSTVREEDGQLAERLRALRPAT
jgi:charged multivesicular body protein 1